MVGAPFNVGEDRFALPVICNMKAPIFQGCRVDRDHDGYMLVRAEQSVGRVVLVGRKSAPPLAI